MISESIYLLSIFVLAVFVGYYVVWSVTTALHTPLMSVTNAISSVIIVGAILAIGADLGVSSVDLGDADKGSPDTLAWFWRNCFGINQYFRRISCHQRMLPCIEKR